MVGLLWLLGPKMLLSEPDDVPMCRPLWSSSASELMSLKNESLKKDVVREHWKKQTKFEWLEKAGQTTTFAVAEEACYRRI